VTNDAYGHSDVLIADRRDNQQVIANLSNADLNYQLFDVAFTGEPVQCHEFDGTCDAIRNSYRFDEVMNQNEANDYKYVIDIDGNGWSGRYHRLLSTRSVVLKSTAFVEWYQDRIQPWVQCVTLLWLCYLSGSLISNSYIPVKLDYSDLRHIMTFFVGLNGRHGHDELAKEIGAAGRQWAADYVRRSLFHEEIHLIATCVVAYGRHGSLHV
jgi:hypothetical protein